MSDKKPPAMVYSDGVRVELTNCDSDDFIHCRWSLKATHPDGPSVRWTLPDRLIQRTEILDIALPELLAELDEHVALLKRVEGRWIKKAQQ